jgi:hypothetical protein
MNAKEMELVLRALDVAINPGETPKDEGRLAAIMKSWPGKAPILTTASSISAGCRSSLYS